MARTLPRPSNEAAARRDRVLAWPEIAKRLTEPPLNLECPELWSGFIPPRWIDDPLAPPGEKDRVIENKSPVRRALIEICHAVLAAEDEARRVAEEAAERALARKAAADPQRPAVAPDLVDTKTLTYLHTLLSKAGIVEREDKLATIAEAIGRDEIESSKDLTMAEAKVVIRKLREVIPSEQTPPPEQEPPLTVEPVPKWYRQYDTGNPYANAPDDECPWCTPEERYCPVCRPNPADAVPPPYDEPPY